MREVISSRGDISSGREAESLNVPSIAFGYCLKFTGIWITSNGDVSAETASG